MNQTLTIVGLIIAVWLPLIDYAVFRPKRRPLGPVARLSFFEKLVYAGFVFGVAMMCFSSFGMLAIKKPMHHWALIIHMSIAPVFAVCLTAMALLWAHQSRPVADDETQPRFYLGEKVAFWFTALAGFMTIISALLGMMTWFGSKGQDVLLGIHRFSAMALVIAAVFHAARILLGRPAQGARKTETQGGAS